MKLKKIRTWLIKHKCKRVMKKKTEENVQKDFWRKKEEPFQRVEQRANYDAKGNI